MSHIIDIYHALFKNGALVAASTAQCAGIDFSQSRRSNEKWYLVSDKI